MISHQAYLDVATARDRQTLERQLVEFAEAMGFPLVSAILVVDRPAAPSSFISVGNIPDAYKESYYDPELSRKSPVLARLQNLSHPFTYDQSLYVDDAVSHLWEHQSAFGYKTGIATAFHLDNGRHFLLGVDRDEALPSECSALTRLMADLQLFGAYAQETAIRLLTPLSDSAEDVPSLTPRELEILKWTSVGKSASVIGDILGIHRGTVNFHLQAISKKFAVAGKYAAVAKAIRLRII